MSCLTKTAIAVLALSCSAAFAGAMGPVCVPGNVTTPCDYTAWNFGMAALYLKPTFSADFGYFNSVAGPTGERIFLDYSNNWHWGFKLEGSYHWTPGSDINVNWYHTKFNSDRQAFGPIRLVDSLNVTGGLYERDIHWDAVNGELGQIIMVGCERMRLHTGLQFAEIKTEETRFFPGLAPTVSAWTDFRKSEFNGLGPRGGFDSTYQFGGSLCGFGVYFKSAAAVLVGTSSFENLSTLPIVFSGVPQSHGSKTAMVPLLEAKLGVSYEYALAQADLLCDVGYMWFNYFEAEHNVNAAAIPSNEADFAASGLYFGVVYKGYV